jgi:hypothetical protein
MKGNSGTDGVGVDVSDIIEVWVGVVSVSGDSSVGYGELSILVT